jgi:hypothetical protein
MRCTAIWFRRHCRPQLAESIVTRSRTTSPGHDVPPDPTCVHVAVFRKVGCATCKATQIALAAVVAFAPRIYPLLREGFG